MPKKIIMFSLLSVIAIICGCESDINNDNTNSNDTNSNPQQIELGYESPDQGGSIGLDDVKDIPVADDVINDNYSGAKDLGTVDSLGEV